MSSFKGTVHDIKIPYQMLVIIYYCFLFLAFSYSTTKLDESVIIYYDAEIRQVFENALEVQTGQSFFIYDFETEYVTLGDGTVVWSYYLISKSVDQEILHSTEFLQEYESQLQLQESLYNTLEGCN